MNKNALLFLAGLGSLAYVRVIGTMPITELACIVSAPLVFCMDLNELRRDGFMPFLSLAVMTIVGCAISCWVNHTPTYHFLRGMANTYSTFAVPVVMHRLVRRNLGGVKWYFIGCALSAIVTIWGFKMGHEAYQIDTKSLDEVKSAGLYYAMHFGPSTLLPLYAFYLSSPTLLSIGCLSITTLHTVLTTASGRASLLTLAASSSLLIYVRRRWSLMTSLKKHLTLIGLSILGVLVLIAAGYKFLGRMGMLNERAQAKYEQQIVGKEANGALGMLMAGRSEFFVAMFAAIDNPIIGLGVLPVDRNRYMQRFLENYGTESDAEAYYKRREELARMGIYQAIVPCHSMIACNWMFCGISGLLFWLYFLYKMYILMRRHIDAVPQWFGYFAFWLPASLWNIFFSPIGGRAEWGMFYTLVLIATAVGEGKIGLPYQMAVEARKHDRSGSRRGR